MMEFISWDDFPFPTVSGNRKHVPNHQPDPTSTNVEASYNGGTLKCTKVACQKYSFSFLGVWIKDHIWIRSLRDLWMCPLSGLGIAFYVHVQAMGFCDQIGRPRLGKMGICERFGGMSVHTPLVHDSLSIEGLQI